VILAVAPTIVVEAPQNVSVIGPATRAANSADAVVCVVNVRRVVAPNPEAFVADLIVVVIDVPENEKMCCVPYRYADEVTAPRFVYVPELVEAVTVDLPHKIDAAFTATDDPFNGILNPAASPTFNDCS
jgi:hypothetical protein